MQAVTTIGLDIAKSVFQVHGVDAAGQVLIRRQLKRRAVLAFFEKLPVCLVGIEACLGALTAPTSWHSRAGGGAVHSIMTGLTRCSKTAPSFDQVVHADGYQPFAERNLWNVGATVVATILP